MKRENKCFKKLKQNCGSLDCVTDSLEQFGDVANMQSIVSQSSHNKINDVRGEFAINSVKLSKHSD